MVIAKLNAKYYKGITESPFEKKHIILPPINKEELQGYVCRLYENTVIKKNNYIEITHGNETKKGSRKYDVFMFEKEDKDGKRNKRYRFDTDEFNLMYGCDKDKHFAEKVEERAKIKTGKGRLLRTETFEYDNKGAMYDLKRVIKWYIANDTDTKWCYPYDYNEIRNIDKVSMTAKGFSLLEEYPLDDVAALFDNYDLFKTLEELESIRSSLEYDLKMPQFDFASLIPYRVFHNSSYNLQLEMKKDIEEFEEQVKILRASHIINYYRALEKDTINKAKKLANIEIKTSIYN